MKTFISPNGYFYKEYKNGKKKRISKKLYYKLNKNMKEYKIGGSKPPNGNSETLLCFDFDECLSDVNFYYIFLRGSEYILDLLQHKNGINTKNLLNKEKTTYRGHFEREFKKVKTSKFTNYLKEKGINEEELKERIGLKQTKMDQIGELYTSEFYMDFLETFVIPNKSVINDLQLLLNNGHNIIILTNGRCFTFIRQFFYTKFKGYESYKDTHQNDERTLFKFIRLFDSINKNHIKICGLPGISNAYNTRCLFNFKSDRVFKEINPNQTFCHNGPWTDGEASKHPNKLKSEEFKLFGLVELDESYSADKTQFTTSIFPKLNFINDYLLNDNVHKGELKYFPCTKAILFDDSDHYKNNYDNDDEKGLLKYNNKTNNSLGHLPKVTEIQFKKSKFNENFKLKSSLYDYIQSILKIN